MLLMGQVISTLWDWNDKRIKKPIHLFLDGGSSHNFLDLQYVQKNGLYMEQIPTIIANTAARKVSITNICRTFSWHLKGTEFLSDCYVIPLSFCDLLLGVQWLSTLSKTTWDYLNLTLKFNYKGKYHFLRGKQNNSNLKTVSSVILNRLELNECTLALLQISDSKLSFPFINALNIHNVDELATLPLEITEVLQDNQEVFAETHELPPNRAGFDHKIPTLPDSMPINKRPYKYSILQKDVIEKIVAEMLSKGIIQNSRHSLLWDEVP